MGATKDYFARKKYQIDFRTGFLVEISSSVIESLLDPWVMARPAMLATPATSKKKKQPSKSNQSWDPYARKFNTEVATFLRGKVHTLDRNYSLYRVYFMHESDAVEFKLKFL